MNTAFRLAIAKVGPLWFTGVMGTGILAVTIGTSPIALPEGGTISAALWLLASAALAVLLAIFAISGMRDTARIAKTFSDPAAMQACGAPPMAFFTVAVGALTIGRHVVPPEVAVAAAQVLFLIGLLGAIGTAFLVPFLMITRHELATETTSATWLLPVVPLIVASVPSALLIPTWPDELRSSMLAIGYALWGAGIALASVVIVLHYARLMQYRAPESGSVTSVWLVVGPLGQSIAGLNALDHAAAGIFPASASLLSSVGVIYGLTTWGFAVYWLLLAIMLTLRAVKTKLPFALGWWAFTFPVGVLTAGTYSLTALTESPLFRFAGLVLLTLLAVMWTLVVAATTRQALRELRAEQALAASAGRRTSRPYALSGR
jgi:C4-dicarboxylate transporter/malic acid transport protein